ncbi:hypothetical protein SEA_JKERNS_25 [Arthrobacter phage JKerns]|uniref:Uncharacterized protein n=6 Tax=Marthavirus TaxID=1980936 RepID=A0A514A5G8_9CAUD|nr:hypothetical protein FDH50_gp25 [Arthrobacter phage Sonny]YP_009612478.1 hypothetical protein FDI42_gp25 [Arthrobacter phage Shade]YP_009884246.1 hypothetical protein HYP98_gp25 [Arthrobacter phage Zartrosa]ALY10482.1 hypothetical protein TAEYOUNG_25 [Arthrobacter phage TaeYoung]ASR80578.1 hypothetical protein SEA_JORDAN_25 [Arthrobacter phage Jordan]KUR65803.1 hypothetical protein JM67_03355 [Arthrobacter sp. ATCC 21022]QDH48515.1 hypothetical protein SEA_GREKAYCON_25 [Arthrobacter phage 
MFSDLPAWVGDQLTPWTLLLFLALGFFTGRVIVPRYYYNEIVKDRDQWRTTAQKLTGSVGTIAETLPEVLEGTKTVDKIMTVVKRKADAEIGSGDS